MRFDLKYIDSNGKEYLDHYYYDSVNGLSNKPADEKLAGEADLVFFEDQEKEEKEEKENHDLIKSAEYKDGNFNFTSFAQYENHHLDVGGNEDGSKGFISQITYAFNEETNKYTSLDASGLQNGYDYRGDTTSVRSYWIEAWNGKDSLRFDLTYIDSSGKEYLDHYYYDSANGLSNKPTDKKLAGEADLVFFKEDEKNVDQPNDDDDKMEVS